MDKQKLKPPLNAINASKIVQAITGVAKEVLAVTPFTPERDQKTFLCDLKNGKSLVIKYATLEERKNQNIFANLGIKTPRIIGDFLEVERKKKEKEEKEIIKGWYGQEYVEYEKERGPKTLNFLLNKGDLEAKDVFYSAIELLVQIHNSKDDFERKKGGPATILNKTYLEKDMQKRVNNRFLPLFKTFREKGKYKQKLNRWEETLQSFNIKSAISLLCSEQNPEVFVRWDYKPDNLLVKKQNGTFDLFTIDWGVVYTGSPWFDLAFLLGDIGAEKRNKFIKEYLQLQEKKNPRWQKLIYQEVKRKMKSAYAIIQLIHASTNAKIILNNQATRYNYKNLLKHLTKLKEELR